VAAVFVGRQSSLCSHWIYSHRWTARVDACGLSSPDCQQNAQTEFEHFEDSRDELVDIRNSISTAGQVDVTQFPSLKLGTTYQSRLLTVNPPPPAGTLQTSDAYNITIANDDGEQLNITTRFLEYQPGYNEIQVGSTRFEHSVLYLDERDRGHEVSIIEEQNIVDDGTVRITALQNEFQRTGTDRTTLELYPLETVDVSGLPNANGENYTVSIPTQLTASEYWEDELADAGGVYQDVDNQAYDDDTHALTLSVDEDDLQINTVGIRMQPDENPVKTTDFGDGSGDSGEGVFETLDASVDVGGGNDRPSDVIIDEFEISSGTEITFIATEARGDTAQTTTSAESGEGIVLDLGGAGNNDFPVDVIADITGGECLETTFSDETEDTKSLDDDDWDSC